MATWKKRLALFEAHHRKLEGCRACERMIGPVVHGPPVLGPMMLVGQAPGPREGSIGRPFAWTAGRTLFRWFDEALGVSEERFRAGVYMTAIARCFPGKAKGSGDRKPDAEEIARCRPFLACEAELIAPELVLAVGTLAIAEIVGEAARGKKLAELVGKPLRCLWHGREVDVFALPHPSGASPWHKIEPGKTLLARALKGIGEHPAFRATFAS